MPTPRPAPVAKPPPQTFPYPSSIAEAKHAKIADNSGRVTSGQPNAGVPIVGVTSTRPQTATVSSHFPGKPSGASTAKDLPKPGSEAKPRTSGPNVLPQSSIAEAKQARPAVSGGRVAPEIPKVAAPATGVTPTRPQPVTPFMRSPNEPMIPAILMAPPRPPSDGEKNAEARRLSAKIDALPAAIEQRAREKASACRATSDEVAKLNARFASGASSSSPAASTRRVIEIVLGVDFGTSSTKIVARFPYEAGSPAYAVPVPSFAQAEGHPYLWASRLWLQSDGSFSLSPLSGAAVSCSLKAGLMGGVRGPVMSAMAAQANAEEVVCAFLALQVRQARGWLATERATLMQRGRTTWSYNFGFPAASLNSAGLRDRYQRCIAAALSLAVCPVDVTLATVRPALAAVARSQTAQLERANAALIPEIAAAVSGFASSTMLDDGLYAIVDVGGGTVDCCTFNLFKGRDGAARCPIFLADVAMLGAEVWPGCANDRIRPTTAAYRGGVEPALCSYERSLERR